MSGQRPQLPPALSSSHHRAHVQVERGPAGHLRLVASAPGHCAPSRPHQMPGPGTPGRPRCRRDGLRGRRRRTWRGRSSPRKVRIAGGRGRTRRRGRRAGVRNSGRAASPARHAVAGSSNEPLASRVTAKNSPIGRLKRVLSRSSVRGGLGLPCASAPDVEKPGVAGARTAATAPITAQTTSTDQRQRTSARANRSISFSGPPDLRRRRVPVPGRGRESAPS